MNKSLLSYPYDELGTAVSNRISNEPHTITELNGDNQRLIFPDKAPFFNNNVIVVHQETGNILELGVHYELGAIWADMSLYLSRHIYGYINIIDSTLSGNFVISYQTIGGKFIGVTRELKQKAAEMLLTPRRIRLEDIIDLPNEFPPRQHGINGMEDLVGFKDIEKVLKDIVTVISGNPAIEHSHTMESITGLVDILSRKAQNNYSHKVSLTPGRRLVNHTGSLAVTLPRYETATRVRLRFAVLEANASCEIVVEGTVGGKDTAAYEGAWLRGEASSVGSLYIPDISFSYDISKYPTIYLGYNRGFVDTFVTLLEVTSDNASPDDYITGYSVSPSAIMPGTKSIVSKTPIASE